MADYQMVNSKNIEPTFIFLNDIMWPDRQTFRTVLIPAEGEKKTFFITTTFKRE